MKYYFQDKLRKQMDKDNYNKFISGMDAIYTDFFRSLPKLKIFSYLQEETDQYFFLRKMYQLCHCHGVFNDDILGVEKIPTNVKYYFYLHLFLDFFESFPKFLAPVIKKIWIKSAGHIWKPSYTAREIYRIWLSRYGSKYSIGVKYSILDNYYCELRNDIAHGTVLFDDNNLDLRVKHWETWSKDKKTNYRNDIRNEKTADLVKQFTTFNYIAIIYCTEFDLRLLKLGLENHLDGHCPEWNEYMKIYNESWQKIGN